MNRTLTITAAEWASVRDGRLWLVREQGCSLCAAGIEHGLDHCDMPIPVEFVQACAPCSNEDACAHGVPSVGPCVCTNPSSPPRVTIELVAPCCGADDGYCFQGNCYKIPGSCILGHAYAVGQPLPIREWDEVPIGPSPCLLVGVNEDDGSYRFVMLEAGTDSADLTDRLAHYGPPESLVGKWAIELAVVS